MQLRWKRQEVGYIFGAEGQLVVISDTGMTHRLKVSNEFQSVLCNERCHP